jgi:hypothetical protein
VSTPGTTFSFRVPPDGNVFASEVFLRCEHLIDLGIWAGISKTRLQTWIRNFKNGEERYFAACLLDALIYRSDNQTIAVIQQLFQRVLPDLARKRSWTALVVEDWSKPLASATVDPGVRLVAVVRETDPPKKSANIVLRLMHRHFSISSRCMMSSWQLRAAPPPQGTKIIFVDDFLGTGIQFIEFFRDEQMRAIASAYECVYAPLVAYDAGAKDVQKAIANVDITSVEMLTVEHRLFHAAAECFNDGLNSPSSAEQFYYDLLVSRGIALTGDDRRGFGGLELAYTFEHAAPDNSLPIWWWKDSPAWNPLFDR